MAHAILVPQHLERSDEKHDHNTISKKTGATPGSTKSLCTTSKASPASAPDWLKTTQDIMNVSLSKSIC